MTAADTAAALVLTLARDFTAAVDGYRAFRLDLTAVRTARADLAAAHRAMVATPGDVRDGAAYLAARTANTVSARTTRRLIDLHMAGSPDR